MSAHPTHQVVEPGGVKAPRTIYAAGIYAVSERDLGLNGVEYRVTHTPTGIVIRHPWRAGLACDLAGALDAAFGNVGETAKWGDRAALEAFLNRAGDPAAVIARVLSTDNPHGEPPPNPCPLASRPKMTARNRKRKAAATKPQRARLTTGRLS